MTILIYYNAIFLQTTLGADTLHSLRVMSICLIKVGFLFKCIKLLG